MISTMSDICSNQFQILDISAKLFLREILDRPGTRVLTFLLNFNHNHETSMLYAAFVDVEKTPHELAFFLFSFIHRQESAVSLK